MPVAGAETRAEYKEIDERATAANTRLRDGFRNLLIQSYQTITGRQFQGYGVDDLQTDVTSYIGTYSWYNSFGTRYDSITALQRLLTALAAVNGL